MGLIDIIVFVLFILVVIGTGLLKSKSDNISADNDAENYFLAGRGLSGG